MESLEVISCQIIAAAGGAKSNYVEAIQQAKAGNIGRANELMEEGRKIALTGHKVHGELLAQSAEHPLEINLLLMHAEDQMMSTETIELMAEELIALYQKGN